MQQEAVTFCKNTYKILNIPEDTLKSIRKRWKEFDSNPNPPTIACPLKYSAESGKLLV